MSKENNKAKKDTNIVTVDLTEEVIEESDITSGDLYMADDGRKHVDITYKGIDIDFCPARFGDQRVMYTLGKLQKAKDAIEAAGLQARFLDLMFGADNTDYIMDELAELDNGILSEETFAEFISYLMEEAEAKNWFD